MSQNKRFNLGEFGHRSLIYGLLLAGSIVFMWPFLWMATTSVKLDREMFGTKLRLLPETPIPAGISPYVDTQFLSNLRGKGVDEPVAIVESILEEKSEHISWPEGLDKTEARKQVARGIYQKLLMVLPGSVWALDSQSLREQIAPKVNQELVDQVFPQIHRRLSIGQLRVRSLDLEDQELVSPDGVANAWNVEGPGTLGPGWERGKSFADLRYDFKNEESIKLTQTFTTKFPIERLHRIQLFVRPDNSWHGVSIEVEKLGKRFRSSVPYYLSDTNWVAYSWQEYGPDDLKNKIKTWVWLEPEKAATVSGIESDPNRIKITIELQRNSQLGAWEAKILRNYRLTFNHIPFWRYVSTSLFLVLLNIVLTLFSCSIVAYSFARLQWPGRGFSFALMLATMMIPSQVTMIPHFLIIRWLGWYNTLYPLWVPSLFAGAFNVFLLRQFLKGIPRDLEDAAKIDGCGFWRVYWHVMLPLVRPTLAAIAIFTFMGTWNDFMGPLVYLNDQRLYPLSLGLFALNVQTSGATGSMGIMMAGSLLMTLPVIAIFFAAQRYFLQGVTLTGMKG